MEISGIRIDITVGELEVYRAPSWWIESLRHFPLSRAGITLPDPSGDLARTVKKGDPVSLTLGYRNQEPTVWTGVVSTVEPGETQDQLEVRCVDGALPLTTTTIFQSWENETPEAIIAWAIRQAGLTPAVLGTTGITLPRVSAARIPVWQLVRQLRQTCHDSHGMDMSNWALWLGRDGVNWGGHDEPGDTITIGTGENLLDHQPNDWTSGMGMIETVLLADLTHSRRIHLVDDRRGIDTLHRALRVRHQGQPDRVRTFVWYGEEHG